MTALPPEWEPPTRRQLVGDFLAGAARFAGWALVGLIAATVIKAAIG